MVTMDDVDRAHIDANTAQIDFLTQIIKDNKLHEPNCVAFTTAKDHSGMFGGLASMADGHCHCWLDKDNRAEPGRAFAYYHLKDMELGKIGYINRYWAVQALLESNPSLSEVKSDSNYWGKSHAIVEVTLDPTESTE